VLNKQTFEQFKSYAEQQYPESPDQQAVLIKQLQEQHYYQYMQQVRHPLIHLSAALRLRDILVRIRSRILGSVGTSDLRIRIWILLFLSLTFKKTT
jgi:hypothetical protein